MSNEKFLMFFSPQPRRMAAVYYILIGKRTTSNLFAALDYDLLKYWHLYPNLKHSDYQEIMNSMVKQKLLDITDHEVQLSELGEQKQAEEQKASYQLQYYNGPWMQELFKFEERLILAIQLISEFEHHEKRYIPVSSNTNTQWFVKEWFTRHKTEMHFLERFKQELFSLLEDSPAELANIWTSKLVGYQTNGLSTIQITDETGLSPDDVKFMSIDLVAYIFGQIIKQPDRYSVIAQLVEFSRLPISQTSFVTYQQVKNTADLKRVSQERNLKISTIHDHLIEAAILLPNFDFDYFLPLVKSDSFVYNRLKNIEKKRSEIHD